MTERRPEPDRVAEQLSRMLTDLADDPDAPASTVTARSVLDAARAELVDSAPGASPAAAGTAAPGAAADHTGRPASVGDLHLLAAKAAAAQAKAGRRRTALFSLAAAAAVAAVAVLVIPMAMSGGSGSTSANSAQDAASAAAAPQQSAAGSAAGSGAAAGSGETAAAASAAAAGGADAAAPERGTATQAERPPPDDLAQTNVVPTVAPANPPPVAGSASCWPTLPESAAAGLSAVLPADDFGPPAPLTADCGPDPVAGASVSAASAGLEFVVRVSKADPGRCTRGDGEAGLPCVPRGAGVYLAAEAGGSSTAYVYGNGLEVAVGPAPAGGPTPTRSGLTADQSVAAAQAVLRGMS